jgi:hypothetical protein
MTSSPRVQLGAGVAGIVLGPTSLLVGCVAAVLFAFSPLVLLGPSQFLAYAFIIGGIVAVLGLTNAVESIVRGVRAPHEAHRRSASIKLGVTGAVLCVAAIGILIALWLWAAGQIQWSPTGSLWAFSNEDLPESGKKA